MTPITSLDEVQILHDLEQIAGGYRALLCDIWGVLHNGQVPYEGAVAALQNFRKDHGVVILVSNAPRPSSSIPAQLDAIGVPRDAYDRIVTSGDATRIELEARRGQKVFHLGPERDLPLLEGMGLQRVPVGAADFVLCSGLFDDASETPDDYREMLAEIGDRNLTMICANPDQVVRRGDHMIYCGGALGQSYHDQGGETVYCGKPHPAIYRLAQAVVDELAGRTVPLSDILMIGDGPKTDIKGAEDYGIDGLFIAGGIHAEECFAADGSLNRQGLQDLFGNLSLWPHYILPALC